MSRNLIIACDGTNNEFGPENTNVVRLVQVLDRSSNSQLVYYDPGVGTLPEPGFVTRVGKKVSDFCGLAFGAGLGWKISHAYRFLMDEWEPGDRVFIYGFSRGAYTVRALAGFLHMFGLLPRGNESLLPYAYRLYSNSGRKLRKTVSQHKFWTLCKGFRETFARELPGQGDRRFPVHFLGVWDTVSSVGWVWDPVHFPFTRTNPSVSFVRHAVSIDERRWFFRQNLFAPAGGQNIQELWFPGVHCDVGGGYSVENSVLWQEPFRWMLEESRGAGLIIDPIREAAVWKNSEAVPKPSLGKQSESLTWKWWPAEFFPKLQYCFRFHFRFPAIGLGRHRYIQQEAVPHRSTLERLQACVPPYRPPNLPSSWFNQAGLPAPPGRSRIPFCAPVHPHDELTPPA